MIILIVDAIPKFRVSFENRRKFFIKGVNLIAELFLVFICHAGVDFVDLILILFNFGQVCKQSRFFLFAQKAQIFNKAFKRLSGTFTGNICGGNAGIGRTLSRFLPIRRSSSCRYGNNAQRKYESENCCKYVFFAFHSKCSFNIICGFPSRNISITKRSSPFTAKTLENCHKIVRSKSRVLAPFFNSQQQHLREVPSASPPVHISHGIRQPFFELHRF